MENSVKITLIITIAALLVAFGFGRTYLFPSNNLNVEGTAVVKAMPYVVGVYLNIETSGTSAIAAKDNNSAVYDEVSNNLISAGIEKKDIATQNFNIYEDFVWENNRQRSKGFKAVHSL